MKENIKLVVVGLIACLAVGSVVFAFSGNENPPVNIENCNNCVFNVAGGLGTQDGMLGTDDGSHWDKGTFANGLDVDAGGLTVDGLFTLTGPLTVSAGVTFGSTTVGGASTTIAILVPTTTITAVQICDSSFININASSTGLSPVNDLIFAGTSTMFSACLDAVGKSHSFIMLNASTTEGASLIYSGLGNVLIASPSSTAADADSWSGADYRRVIFTRVSNNTSTVEMYSLRDAD